MRQEDKFLIECVDSNLSDDIVFCEPDVSTYDWNYIIEQTARHRLIPSVSLYLKKMSPKAVPIMIGNYFMSAHRAIALNNFYLAKELLIILSALRENRIEVVPLKGPLLAEMAYGHIGSREFSDIDILINMPDYPKVREVLINAGYKILNRSVGGETKFNNECEYILQRDGKFTKLDIHWIIVEEHYGFKYSTDDILSGAIERKLMFKNIKSLSTEDTMLCMIMHHGKELWRELRYIADVAGIIAKQRDLDWGLLLARSREIGIERNLVLAVYLATGLFNIEIPEWFRQLIANDFVAHDMGERIFKKQFLKLKEYTPGDITFDFSLQRVLNPEINTYHFIKDAFYHLVKPNDIDKKDIKLPGLFHFVYYFRRLYRVIKMYGIMQLFNSFFRFLSTILSAAFEKPFR